MRRISRSSQGSRSDMETWSRRDLGTRMISVVIGLSGILLTGLVAAVGVRALQEATGRDTK